jgi:hypothetical protein
MKAFCQTMSRMKGTTIVNTNCSRWLSQNHATCGVCGACVGWVRVEAGSGRGVVAHQLGPPGCSS